VGVITTSNFNLVVKCLNIPFIGKDTMVRGWLSQSCDVQNLHSRVAATLEETKEFYNENYEDILEILLPEQLLKMPTVLRLTSIFPLIFLMHHLLSLVDQLGFQPRLKDSNRCVNSQNATIPTAWSCVHATPCLFSE
jgi:hypothetical protein